jgi:protein SCO1/2
VGVLAAGAIAFAVFEPIQVLPRMRLAPAFSLVDQRGEAFTSEDAGGDVVLYAFGYGNCGSECDEVEATMAEVAERAAGVDLAGSELRLVTVSFDPANDAGRLAEVAAAAGADGDTWRWVTGDPEDLRTVIGSGFKVFYQETTTGFVFDPAFVLVDGRGVVRGQYRYATLSEDADKLVRHIGLLGEELRNAGGVTSVAYEAAHVFMCYP